MPCPDRPLSLDERERRIEEAAHARDVAVIAGVERLRFFPLAVERGRGSTLTAASGRELIDLSASWTAAGLGLGHPAIAEAIAEAAATMSGASVLSAAGARSTRLAERLAALVPVRGDARVYLGLAGTDANDVAVRGARHATGRERVVAFRGGYHGGLGLAQEVSGFRAGDGEDAPQARLMPFPASAGQLAESLELLDAALAGRATAAVIVEAIQCDGGVIVPPDGFLSAVRAACDRAGTLLIVDEVKAGLGRTGTRFAFEAEPDVLPDVVTLGKSLGGGLPVSAAIGDAAILDGPVASALLTAAGADVPCAAACAVLDLVASDEVAAEAAQRARQLEDALSAYASSGRPGASLVREVRGRGLLRGVELAGAGGEPASLTAARVAYRAWELGTVVYIVREDVLELTPALTIGEAELELGLRRLLHAIDDVAQGAAPADSLSDYAGW